MASDPVITPKHYIVDCDRKGDLLRVADVVMNETLFPIYGGRYVLFCRGDSKPRNPCNDDPQHLCEECDDGTKITRGIEYRWGAKFTVHTGEAEPEVLRDEALRQFQEKYDFTLIWSGPTGTPEVDLVDEIANFCIYPIELYKERITRLKPAHVFNVAQDKEQMDAWKKLLEDEGIHYELIDANSKEGIEKFLDDNIGPEDEIVIGESSPGSSTSSSSDSEDS